MRSFPLKNFHFEKVVKKKKRKKKKKRPVKQSHDNEW